VFQFGWTYYGGQGLDLNCHPEITTSSCCATLGPGQEAPFPRGVVCPADGFSITPFGGQPTEEFTVAKYGADFTIVYNCGIAQVKDPSVNDDDDDDDCKNQSDDNTCADCSAMPRWAVSEPNGA
jgi:hypothetical protein